MQSLGKIAVVGAGAVGGYYGGMLARAGYDVRFLMRSDLMTVRREGLIIRSGGEEWRISAKSAATTAEIGPCDLVIIALKATANPLLQEVLPALLGPETALLTLQNGLGNEEFLAAHWGAARALGGLCFVCLNRVAPGVIEHYDHGTLSIGEFNRTPQPRTAAIVEAFRESGIDAKAVQNLAEERWRKLVWNIPFNGLAIGAAARSATVADVLAAPGLRDPCRSRHHGRGRGSGKPARSPDSGVIRRFSDRAKLEHGTLPPLQPHRLGARPASRSRSNLGRTIPSGHRRRYLNAARRNGVPASATPLHTSRTTIQQAVLT